MIDNHGLVHEFFLISREFKVGSRVKSVATVSAYRREGKSLLVLQFDCRSVYNKALEF